VRRPGLALVAAALVAAASGCDEARPAPVRTPAAPEPPARNPIEEKLAAGPPAARQEGTAVLVLVDSSGSMDDSVLDVKGAPRRKIEIARHCVALLVRQAEKFAKEHPDVPILLGIEEFSGRGSGPACRTVVPLAPPHGEEAERQLGRIHPGGGTPIGDAVLEAKLQLDRRAFRRNHILVITDGENTRGYAPSDVVSVITRLPEDRRASIYFIAFDIAAEHFHATRDAGALVLGASNERELLQTLDYVVSGKILAEQTGPDPKK
jgi:Mg-chelatase subunit ChlD